MNLHLKPRVGFTLAALCGVALVISVGAFRAQADAWDKTTFLTVNEPTQVVNTYLEPGTYMFKLANDDRHIVQIFNSDRTHLINTIFAVPNYRTVRTQAMFTYWETPPGMAKAIRAWFWPGDYNGQEFPYPTQLRQVAAVTPPPPLIAPAPVQPAAPPPLVNPQPEPEAAVPAPQQQTESQENVVIAQNNPPPTPPQPVAPPPADQTQLPHTASLYPLVGLGGLLSLGLYFALRVKQFS